MKKFGLFTLILIGCLSFLISCPSIGNSKVVEEKYQGRWIYTNSQTEGYFELTENTYTLVVSNETVAEYTVWTIGIDLFRKWGLYDAVKLGSFQDDETFIETDDIWKKDQNK